MGNEALTACKEVSSDVLQACEDIPRGVGAVVFDEACFDDIYECEQTPDNFLGAGKFAQVYLGWQRSDPSSRYAVKVISTKSSSEAELNRIREEINILQALGRHRSMVSIVDVDETWTGEIKIVLELCEGGELYERVRQLGHFPEAQAQACCRNILEAVAYFHGKGVMHRDLKPENILLCSRVCNTEIKISDFGLAKMSRSVQGRLPRSNSICGSDFYLAPEVILQQEYGREIDIWAVGVISYVLLSGSMPFFHEVLHKLYRMIVERDLRFNEPVWKRTSKGAMDFVLRLLQIRPGDRLTAETGQRHPWLRGVVDQALDGPTGIFEHSTPVVRSVTALTQNFKSFHESLRQDVASHQLWSISDALAEVGESVVQTFSRPPSQEPQRRRFPGQTRSTSFVSTGWTGGNSFGLQEINGIAPGIGQGQVVPQRQSVSRGRSNSRSQSAQRSRSCGHDMHQGGQVGGPGLYGKNQFNSVELRGTPNGATQRGRSISVTRRQTSNRTQSCDVEPTFVMTAAAPFGKGSADAWDSQMPARRNRSRNGGA